MSSRETNSQSPPGEEGEELPISSSSAEKKANPRHEVAKRSLTFKNAEDGSTVTVHGLNPVKSTMLELGTLLVTELVIPRQRFNIVFRGQTIDMTRVAERVISEFGLFDDGLDEVPQLLILPTPS